MARLSASSGVVSQLPSENRPELSWESQFAYNFGRSDGHRRSASVLLKYMTGSLREAHSRLAGWAGHHREDVTARIG